MIKKPKRGAHGLNVYSNLSAKRRSKKDAKARKKAEYLASLPKHPVKRLLYRMHPKRFFAYWFSKEGLFMALKITGVAILLAILFTGALFAYFRQELDQIRPEELAKRVQTTVTRYYDRNDILLWEDKGENDYRLAVDSNELSQYLKDATVAIEDRDFYDHAGVSLQGIGRALVNNFSGGNVQGGSTLTQQLVKQVFISEEEAQKRGISGIPRKIKESILAIEVERMYNKDQILTLYLNESPYGGRRNGAESAAQTYFGKSAKDLNLAEASLIAGIPQQPGIYDPYNPAGHEALLARQHVTLNNMAELGYITKKEAEEAKKVPVLDQIRPESDQFKDIKAPHFVQMVRADLEEELGKATVGRGGLTVKTTLDWRVQEVVQTAIHDLFESSLPQTAGFNNSAATIVDSQTGQILALQGSRDYNYPGYGQDNAADAFIQPGSSIKPLVFSALFKQKPAGQPNYGAGTILSDENIDSLVGYDLNNFDNRFRGNIPIRSGLAESRNIPAVKAYLISGRSEVLQTIWDAGDKSYCTQGVDQDAGAALAIGGCGLKQTEHANAFATFARMGQYKPVSSVLEVKNTDGDILKQWKDEGKQAFDSQIAYIISDILSDDAARAPSFGAGAAGLNVPGVKTATKTGTSNIGDDSKDLWMMSYTPKASLGIWVGNNDTSPMNHALSSIIGPTVSQIMGPIHTDIFQPEGTWAPGDWFERPEGVQDLNVGGRTDLFPSWYSSEQRNNGEAMTFDRVSKKKATDCTPDAARIEINVQKIRDPVTNRETIIAPDGYNGTEEDDLHKCDDVKPFVSSISANRIGSSNRYRIAANVNQGTHGIQTVELTADGQTVTLSGNYRTEITFSSPGQKTITVKVVDSALYEGSASQTITVPGGRANRSGDNNDDE